MTSQDSVLAGGLSIKKAESYYLNFDTNYLRTGKTEWAKTNLGSLAGSNHPDLPYFYTTLGIQIPTSPVSETKSLIFAVDNIPRSLAN